MANIRLAKQKEQKPQVSEQAVALHSICVGGKPCNDSEALKIALSLLENICSQVCSPDILNIAFIITKRQHPQYVELIDALAQRADSIRRGNPMSGMF